MTSEQIDALEEWIVAIIADRDRASDVFEAVVRQKAKVQVKEAFGILLADWEKEA